MLVRSMPWATVVLAGILAGLIALGHNSFIHIALVSTVGTYLGVDLRRIYGGNRDHDPGDPESS